MSDLISLESVPLSEVKYEWPERAMAYSAAEAQIKLKIDGAKKSGNEWRAVLSYERSEGDIKIVETQLKKSTMNYLYVSLDFYHPLRGTYYRDVYLA